MENLFPQHKGEINLSEKDSYELVRFLEGRYRKAYFLKNDLANVRKIFSYLSEIVGKKNEDDLMAYFIDNAKKTVKDSRRGSAEFIIYRSLLENQLDEYLVGTEFDPAIKNLAVAIIRYNVGDALNDRDGD